MKRWRHGLSCDRALSLLLSAALLLSAQGLATAALGADPISPESANNERFGVEQEGQQLSNVGSFTAAAELYWSKGIELKDPVLLIDAAEAWLDQAEAERSLEAAQTAIERVALPLDMLHYLRDSSVSASWEPVASEHLDTMIRRGEGVVRDAQLLITEIEAEEQAALTPPEPPDQGRQRSPAKPGTGLIAGGAAALVLGVGGLGVGAAGLSMGAKAQQQVEDPTVFAAEHRQAELRGKNGNVIAGVGLAIGGVGVIAGAVLIVLGVKKRKQAGPPAEAGAEARIAPLWFGEGGGGLVVTGRF